MKTEQEIRDEIGAAERTIENYRNAVKKGSFPKESLQLVITENQSIIAALRWVLGENDRYD